MTDMEKLLEKLEEMKRLENCFLGVNGAIDLMEMSKRVPESLFREYTSMCREWRAHRT